MLIPLLVLMILMTSLPAMAEGSIKAEIPFTVEYAPGTVVMEALDGAPDPTPGRMEGKAEGTFVVELTKPGNYAYTMVQLPGADENVTYDATVFEVDVSVMVNEDGSLYTTVTVSVAENTHKPEKIAFVNVRKTGSLCVAKEVRGDAGDQEREWHFTITLSEALTGLYDGVWFDLGTAHITLRHGETLTIGGLPAGLDYEVTEDEANADGYVTTSDGAKGTIGDGTTSDITFVNEKNTVPPEPTTSPAVTKGPNTTPDKTTAPISPTTPKTGDDSNLMLWIGLAAVSLIAIVAILLKARKR